MTENCEKPTVSAMLRSMKVGESLVFSADKYTSLRSMIATRGFEWGMSFSSCLDRKNRTVTIIRNN